MVCEIDGEIVSHIMFSKGKVNDEEVLILAPLAVKYDFQNMGIGSSLIRTCHDIARNMNFRISCVLGSDTFYKRFSYKKAELFGIRAPFEVESRYFMAQNLKDPLDFINLNGVLEYPAAFGIK